jgi:hypothetical protein
VKVEKKNSDGSYSLVYTSDGFEVRRGVVKIDFKV